MTFRQLALSNVRGNAQRYAAYFLSSVFSVVLFFLYAQFIFHPDVTGGYVYGGSRVRSAMIACQVLILTFSFFFVLYSTSSFLRARRQEFGLLMLLGTTRSQLRKLIVLESTVLSTTAIGVGIGLGLLLSKLFLMAMSRLLMVASPIRFAFLPEAVLVTAVSFVVLFQVITLIAVLGVGRQQVNALLTAARTPKAPPRASIVWAAVALLLIGGGYAVAISQPVVLAFFPVIAVVTVGTFLLFGQASVFVLRALQKTSTLYLRGTRLVIVSQLVFRITDNARLLATVAILSAVVLTSSGTFYVVARQFALINAAAYPQAYVSVESGAAGRRAPSPQEVDAVLARNGVEPTLRVDVRAIELPYRLVGGADEVVRRAFVIPERDYLHLLDRMQARLPSTPLVRGELRYVSPSLPGPEAGTDVPTDVAAPNVDLAATDWFSPAGLAVTESVGGVLFSPIASSGAWIVANDEDFAAIAEAAPAENDLRIYAVDWPTSSRTRAVNEQVSALVDDAQAPYTADRFGSSLEIRQTLGLTMFIGLFIALLFFVASGSLIYFKLFTELQDDRQLFIALERIGLTGREMANIVTSQMGLIFFLPFSIGAVHTVFALHALGRMVQVNVMGYAFLVVALYALVQGVFFVLTRWTYLRTLRPAV